MRFLLSLGCLFISLTLFSQSYTIVLHGGAGDGIHKEALSKEKVEAYKAKMREALEAGQAILDTGGKAEQAVVAVISILEDSPLFNAGKGSVFTYEGINEMDASIMRGVDLNAGAITGVTTIRNPIMGALKVMEQSPHVMLSGEGAERFAQTMGLQMEERSYFQTQPRKESLERFLKRQGALFDGSWEDTKMGTVGCVVLDTHGNLAAGTSTGGMTGKRYGRIGDSPIIGAGTYANNQSCAVSCTGHGEYFIRYAVARDIHARMLYGGASLAEATSYVIQTLLLEAGGKGGLIAVDSQGNISMEFNTKGMFRASIKKGEEAVLLMF